MFLHLSTDLFVCLKQELRNGKWEMENEKVPTPLSNLIFSVSITHRQSVIHKKLLSPELFLF